MAEEVLEVVKDTETSEPALGGMLIRDAAAVVGLLALWGGAEAWLANTSLALALITAVGASLVAGWSIAGLFHEWGHYVGAKLARAAAPRVKVQGLSFFRFTFNLETNGLRQFAAMSIGGNVAHWAAVAAAVLLVPMTTPGQVTFVSSTVAFAVFASVIEWPIIARTASGRVRPIEAFAHLDRAFLRRHYVIGGIGGLLFLAFA
ncbi:MAG: hypothetical protein OXP09_05520 [Gammaproteobacteria bacterium]|nr:hypothetical protein [Gammaproteobacteria bacterium]MDE0365017.1 hypothetical protein [Gammaproteobacteria bacterium]